MRKIIVLGGNHDQIPYIRELKKLNFYIILTDINENAPGKELCNEFHCISYEQNTELLNLALSLKLNPNDRVFTAASQFAHEACAKISQACGIDYPEVSTIQMILDKKKYYKEFELRGLPIPQTNIVNEEAQLNSIMKKVSSSDVFYLKSDFSKNPNYVYKFTPENYSSANIFWGKDNFLREGYLLQKEVLGRHVRINRICKTGLEFDFFTHECIHGMNIWDNFSEITDTLDKFLEIHHLNNWLVKFDLIINSSGWVVLDIGIDPPLRMKNHLEKHGTNFVREYVLQYVFGESRLGSV